MEYSTINLTLDEVLAIISKRLIDINYVDNVISIEKIDYEGIIEYLIYSNVYIRGNFFAKQSVLSNYEIMELLCENYENEDYFVGGVEYSVENDTIFYKVFVVSTYSRKLKGD